MKTFACLWVSVCNKSSDLPQHRLSVMTHCYAGNIRFMAAHDAVALDSHHFREVLQILGEFYLYLCDTHLLSPLMYGCIFNSTTVGVVMPNSRVCSSPSHFPHFHTEPHSFWTKNKGKVSLVKRNVGCLRSANAPSAAQDEAPVTRRARHLPLVLRNDDLGTGLGLDVQQFGGEGPRRAHQRVVHERRGGAGQPVAAVDRVAARAVEGAVRRAGHFR